MPLSLTKRRALERYQVETTLYDALLREGEKITLHSATVGLLVRALRQEIAIRQKINEILSVWNQVADCEVTYFRVGKLERSRAYRKCINDLKRLYRDGTVPKRRGKR